MANLSAIAGPPLETEKGIGSLTLPGFIAEIAQRYHDNEALRWRDLEGNVLSWTYGEVFNECRKVAKALIATGISRDTRVGVLISNRPEWIFTVFGAAMAGATIVALNTFSTQQELNYQLQVAEVNVLLMEAGVASRNFLEDIFSICPTLKDTTPGNLFHPALPFLRRIVCIDEGKARDGLQDWQKFLALGESIPSDIGDNAGNSSSPIDQGLIFFSSGSTALPKAIQQSHRAATLQCWRFGKWYGFDSSVRTWSANGFFFSGNFAMAFGTLSVGGCLVLQRYFNPDETLEIMQSEQVSCAIAWPHQEARLKECPGWETADLSTLKYVDVGGILATHPSIQTDWRQPWGYGSTESFTLVTGMAGSENDGKTFGQVLPGNIIRIVDPDSGDILPLGETGEIIVKGPTLTRGYLKTPPEETFDDEGFFHTADAGYFTDDGKLCWEGRLSDIIKTGGANVSPSEIDAVLCEHPAIMSVFTVGIPHETLGEIVVSCVVLREGQTLDEGDLRQFAKRSLASYKIPRRALFFAEKELPMTGSNKIRRPELKKLAAARLEAAS